MLRRAARILELEKQRREQLAIDAEVPLLGVGRFVLEAVTRDARVGGNQFGGRSRLDRNDRGERIGNRPHARKVERVGLVLDVLRNHERHVEMIEIAGRVGARKVGDPEAGPKHGSRVTRQVVGQTETRREVEVLRLLVRAAADAVFARVDDAEGLVVEVREPVVLVPSARERSRSEGRR